MSYSQPKVIRLVALIFFAVVVAGLMIWALVVAKSISSKTRKPLPVYGKVSNFELLDQNGKKTSLKDLLGKIWVANFIFTRCAGPCPIMSSQMAQLQKSVREIGGVKLVSFSLDPKYDQPAILKEYATGFGADPQVWIFLTGDEKQILRMSREDFKLAVKKTGGDPQNSMTHGTYFTLVDPKGRIRGYYSSTGANPAPKIVLDILRLKKTPGEKRD